MLPSLVPRQLGPQLRSQRHRRELCFLNSSSDVVGWCDLLHSPRTEWCVIIKLHADYVQAAQSLETLGTKKKYGRAGDINVWRGWSRNYESTCLFHHLCYQVWHTYNGEKRVHLLCNLLKLMLLTFVLVINIFFSFWEFVPMLLYDGFISSFLIVPCLCMNSIDRTFYFWFISPGMNWIVPAIQKGKLFWIYPMKYANYYYIMKVILELQL